MVKVGDIWRYGKEYETDWEVLGRDGDKCTCRLLANTHPKSMPIGYVCRILPDPSDTNWTQIKPVVEIEYV